ncbi:MAG TPA: polyphosphate kinase 1 [Candidatus Hydrogenedens sp.]|nr:polyphosphate kinase 1 [Candidatus Hydrogenedens sp.]HOL18927.1 polyphosphate kinase 1 [Candidatus Hydrogenedens sp.]HPP57573.1 polyphosphate kinase 1 [Candidatus Hydrogenedens sp.]
MLNKERIFHTREISILSFNERVLQEAEDSRNPLLERLKFLGIFSSNMDEFFKVRVASVKRRLELGEQKMAYLLEVIGDFSRELDERFRQAYQTITEELANYGIRILTHEELKELSPSELQWLSEYFQENILHTLVPILLQEKVPLPPIIDGAIYFAIQMNIQKNKKYAILEIPSVLPRFIELPSGNISYIDDVIRLFLNDVFYIFPYDDIEAYEFKISRDAELDIDNDFSEGYIRKMRKVLEQRKGGRPTRFHYDEQMPRKLCKKLLKELKISEEDTVIAGGRYHNMKDLINFPARRQDLLFEPLPPVEHPVLSRTSKLILDIVEKQDILLTYPYQSFDHVIRLIRESAIDPDVEEIKITIYRVANQSRIVNALINAARNGKKVFASIELQARFDEQHNIQIAERLAEAGVRVAYGVPPMKVHAKFLFIKRKGKKFVALSTGNFNEKTARQYVDSILLTSNVQIAEEVEEAIRLLDRTSGLPPLKAPDFEHILVSPFTLRKSLNRLINREKEKGSEGYILLKVNHLTDTKIIKKLKETADAGVHIDLIVRTTYAMPAHANIYAISILDRFLEHQRIYIFGRGANADVYFSSADLMERNLDYRVESAFPILNPELKQQVLKMVSFQIQDNVKARILDERQTNRYVEHGKGIIRAQYATYQYFSDYLTSCESHLE